MNNTLTGIFLLQICLANNIGVKVKTVDGVFYSIDSVQNAGAKNTTIEAEFGAPNPYPGFNPSRVMATADKFIE